MIMSNLSEGAYACPYSNSSLTESLPMQDESGRHRPRSAVASLIPIMLRIRDKRPAVAGTKSHAVRPGTL